MTTTTLKINTLKRTTSKKLRIKRNRKLVALFIFISSLFIIITSVKNMYISYRCSDLIYAIDHYFTTWSNKDLRLIRVESIAILSKNDNSIEIEASGFAYKKPYNETSLIGIFKKDSKGHWTMKSVKLKNNSPNIEDKSANSLD